MNKNEIISEYRQAKNKRAQIDILAELNAVPKERIEAILVEGGGWSCPSGLDRRLREEQNPQRVRHQRRA